MSLSIYIYLLCQCFLLDILRIPLMTGIVKLSCMMLDFLLDLYLSSSSQIPSMVLKSLKVVCDESDRIRDNIKKAYIESQKSKSKCSFIWRLKSPLSHQKMICRIFQSKQVILSLNCFFSPYKTILYGYSLKIKFNTFL